MPHIPSLDVNFAAKCARAASQTRRLARTQCFLRSTPDFVRMNDGETRQDFNQRIRAMPVYIDGNPNGFRIDGEHAEILTGHTRATANGGMGFVAPGVGTRQNEVLFSFRGSDTQNNLLNDGVLTDCNIAFYKSVKHHAVHAGFDAVVRSMLGQMKTIMTHRFPTRTTFHFTGHSMGGALAALAAEALWRPGLNFHVHSFGAPRCGDMFWAMYMTRNMTQFNRYYFEDDPVPALPVFPYFHAKGASLGYHTSNFAAMSSHGQYFRRHLVANHEPQPWWEEGWNGLKSVLSDLKKGDASPIIPGCIKMTKRLLKLILRVAYAIGCTVFFAGATIADLIAGVLNKLVLWGGAAAKFVNEMLGRFAHWLWRINPWTRAASPRDEVRMRNATGTQWLRWVLEPMLQRVQNQLRDAARGALAMGEMALDY